MPNISLNSGMRFDVDPGISILDATRNAGIAPVKAMHETIPTLNSEQCPRSTTVLWGIRSRSDLYFDINAVHGNHRYIPVPSRADNDWSSARGHVHQILLGLNLDLTQAAVHACGSNAMIHSASKALFNAGLPRQRFYSDAFVCSDANSST